MAEHFIDLDHFEEVTQTGTWRFDRKNYVISFSPFLTRFFGKDYMVWVDFINMVPIHYRSMLHLYKEDIVIPFYLPDGRVEWMKRHYFNYDDDFMFGTLSVVEAPQVASANEALEITVDYFEALYRALPVGVSICNCHGNIIDANEANMQIFKVVDKNQVLGYNVLRDSKLPEELKRQLEEGTASVNYTYTFNYDELKGYYETYGEGEMTLMCRIERLHNRHGNFIGYLVINLDLSELQSKSRELEKMLVKATESDRLKTAFLSNIQHEIRTPLNAITGFADVLMDFADKMQLTEELKGCFQQISDNKKLLLEVFGNVLQLSELESGILKYKHETLDLKELLIMATDIRLSSMPEGVMLKYDLPDEEFWIEGDMLMLHHVISNLVSNAQKFTREGSITVSLRRTESGHAHVEVADTGIGISPEKIDTVFDRFIKMDACMPGSGVGLSICRHIIGMADGKIGVRPNQPNGCVFWFEI